MRPIYFLLFSLFVGQYLKAQPGFEYRQKLGFLLAHRGLMSQPAHALRPVIPINARTLRITAAAGT